MAVLSRAAGSIARCWSYRASCDELPISGSGDESLPASFTFARPIIRACCRRASISASAMRVSPPTPSPTACAPQPDIAAEQIGEIPPRAVLDAVLDGPACKPSTHVWWQVDQRAASSAGRSKAISTSIITIWSRFSRGIAGDQVRDSPVQTVRHPTRSSQRQTTSSTAPTPGPRHNQAAGDRGANIGRLVAARLDAGGRQRERIGRALYHYPDLEPDAISCPPRTFRTPGNSAARLPS